MVLRSLFLFLIWVLLSASACQNEKAANSIKDSEDSIDQIAFDHSGSFPVKMDLFGQSTSHMFQVIDHVNEEVVSKVKNVAPQFLRFPGGTGSNYYHFFEKGYGFNIRDAELSKGFDPHPKMLKRVGIEKNRVDQGKAEENYATKCVELAQSLDVPVVLVVNMFSGSDKENLALVNYFIEHNVLVKGIELGNEYYFKAYTSQFPDCREYIMRCKSFVSKLKIFHPKIPVAVTAANPPMEIAYSLKSRFQDWNNCLASEDFYDAYIVHFYSKTLECDDLQDLKKRFECASLKNLELLNKWNSIGLDYYEMQFGTDKEIWLTEFNVKNVFKQYGNTAIQALYSADLLLNIMRNGKVDLAIYHNLLTNSYGFAMINRTKDGLKERVATKMFGLFSQLNDSYIVLPNAIIVDGNDLVEQLVLYSDKEKKYLCYIVNQNSSEISIKMPNTGSTQMKLKGFFADHLYSGIGPNAFESSESNSGVHDVIVDINSHSLDIDSYSFSLIELKLP